MLGSSDESGEGALAHWRSRTPGDREKKMFEQRTVEGLTLREIAEFHGLHYERIRQLLKHYFQLVGVTPAAVQRRKQKAREKAATKARSI
jgi:DNA-binding CsgD family transcriptional regulator